MNSNWRTVEAWRDMNVCLTTPSNEACKMFDATLTQYVTWQELDSVGGIQGSLDKMLQADSDFVMGHVMKNGLELIGTGHTTRLDPEFKADFDRMVELSEKQTGLSASEKSHVKALQLFADGHMALAANVWEDILIDHPLDMLALKFAHDSYFYLGQSNQIRDSIARVLKHYQPSNPFYGYHFGMYSFGLEETNLYDQAEKMARKGLEINPGDAWSTHTICHVMEMMGRQDEGISFLDKTVKDWEGEYQAALDILDTQVKVRASKSGALLDIIDICSLLFRLQMEGVNVGDRWEDMFEVCRPHLADHILVFNDIHLLLSCLGAGKADATKDFMKSFEEFVRDGAGCQHDVASGVGQTLCQAFVSYSAGDFASVVDLLYPVRYQIISIGGSHAQRDLFNLLLIQAAIKSSTPRHHCLARTLLAERKTLKENAPMTDRLIAHAMAVHAD